VTEKHLGSLLLCLMEAVVVALQIGSDRMVEEESLKKMASQKRHLVSHMLGMEWMTMRLIEMKRQI